MAIKYIFVTGGVVSSLGKGITAASIGRLLTDRGLKVTMQKLDPYINVDPGTMSPYQHGEVFVTDDGAECDLDLGHYERFIDVNLNKNSNVTAGKIYWSVITKERHGDFGGHTIQVIPHITNEIIERMRSHENDENNPDVIIVEVGGTVGDIESLPFLEAIRQMKRAVGEENCLYCHVTLLPYLSKAGELKTKPTQHSVKELRSIGIQPDIIVLRSEKQINADTRAKIALFCDVEEKCVIQNVDANSIYEVPLLLKKQGADEIICDKLGLKDTVADGKEWEQMVAKSKVIKTNVEVAIVGKYTELKDAYISVVEALYHAGVYNSAKVNIRWIKASDCDDYENAKELLKGAQGILVPGGYGERGIPGKINAARYARENKIPYLGLCLGMQVAVIEFARNVLGLKDANSLEFDPNTANPVINLMADQKNESDMGGTQRLGMYQAKIKQGTHAFAAYGGEVAKERHRHRYEFNNNYRETMEAKGMVIAGVYEQKNLVEIIEIKDNPWFVGVQFHPELTSRPNRPNPLFRDFVTAIVKESEK